MIRAIKNFIRTILVMLLILIICVVGISYLITKDQKDNIVYRFDDHDQKIGYPYTDELKSYDPQAIIVLGAGVREDGSPSDMLRDRLEAAAYIYNAGLCDKILVSGDNGQEEYNEVKTMYNYLVGLGVPDYKIFVDHAGFSTYDSMYRAHSIFKINRAFVVTQEYHLSRALYIGNNIGMECYGIASDQERYVGQLYRGGREILARDKDFLKTLIKARAKFGGEAIPISGHANGLAE